MKDQLPEKPLLQVTSMLPKLFLVLLGFRQCFDLHRLYGYQQTLSTFWLKHHNLAFILNSHGGITEHALKAVSLVLLLKWVFSSFATSVANHVLMIWQSYLATVFNVDLLETVTLSYIHQFPPRLGQIGKVEAHDSLLLL